jgi:glutamate synthase (NADPH/NADH) small chain
MMIESLKYMPHPKEANESLAKHFTDLAPALNARQAAIESARCLYCYDAPCTHLPRIDVAASSAIPRR